MNTYQIKTETADKLRAAAPKFGLVPSEKREIVAPGIEASHLNPFAAVEFEKRRKKAKVSPDVLISRILKSA